MEREQTSLWITASETLVDLEHAGTSSKLIFLNVDFNNHRVLRKIEQIFLLSCESNRHWKSITFYGTCCRHPKLLQLILSNTIEVSFMDMTICNLVGEGITRSLVHPKSLLRKLGLSNVPYTPCLCQCLGFGLKRTKSLTTMEWNNNEREKHQEEDVQVVVNNHHHRHLSKCPKATVLPRRHSSSSSTLLHSTIAPFLEGLLYNTSLETLELDCYSYSCHSMLDLELALMKEHSSISSLHLHLPELIDELHLFRSSSVIETVNFSNGENFSGAFGRSGTLFSMLA